jgi:transcriptional regulator with XRE-family HTH domain
MRKVKPSAVADDPSVTDAAAFGATIRAARTASGLSIAEAAALLGIAKQTLSDLETARASVGLATALAAARELGVAVFAVPAADREPARRALRALSEPPAVPPAGHAP